VKFSGHLAVGLVAINLLSVAAVGVADKTEELLKKDGHQIEAAAEVEHTPRPPERSDAPLSFEYDPASDAEAVPGHQH
jgi:hypothetical protein